MQFARNSFMKQLINVLYNLHKTGNKYEKDNLPTASAGEHNM